MSTIALPKRPYKRKVNRVYAKHPLHRNPDLAREGFNITFEKRFWSKVRRTKSCWFWIGGINPKGYGAIHKGGSKPRMIHAHRAIWILYNGSVPDGFEVCHSCDKNYPANDITYRSCVRPDHLHLATHADNMRESAVKGRANGLTGENHNCSKLTNDQVAEIRKLYRFGCRGSGCHAIGKKFGVDGATIHAIVTRQTWNHV